MVSAINAKFENLTLLLVAESPEEGLAVCGWLERMNAHRATVKATESYSGAPGEYHCLTCRQSVDSDGACDCRLMDY